MKTLILLFCALLLPQVSFAAREVDELLGNYQGVQPDGRACHLELRKERGKINLEFTDSMSSRTLPHIGEELAVQVYQRAPVFVFNHDRKSLGDVTLHLEIVRGTDGLPVAMRGAVAGWLHAEVDCREMKR